MNNFLERQSAPLGGPKPKGWTIQSSHSRRSPQHGAPAALPAGGGLPVFEKRVQLKETLPREARGSPLKSGLLPGPLSAADSPTRRAVAAIAGHGGGGRDSRCGWRAGGCEVL